jgi:hypothetical protein
VFKGRTEMSNTRLEDMDAALLAKILRLSDAVSVGEYSHAMVLRRTLEDDLRDTNNYANRLADKEN